MEGLGWAATGPSRARAVRAGHQVAEMLERRGPGDHRPLVRLASVIPEESLTPGPLVLAWASSPALTQRHSEVGAP